MKLQRITMSNESKHASEQASHTEQILDILLKEKSLSKEELDRIHHWLINGDRTQEKEEAFVRKFAEQLEYGENRKEALRMWPALAIRLNMDIEACKRLNTKQTGNVFHISSRHRLMRIAAVLIPAIVIVVATIFYTSRPSAKPIKIIAMSVSDGLQKERMLHDSSMVWVNSGSRIEYAEEFGDERGVRLQGEAFFKVTKDADRPFRVKTDVLDIVVLGTEFNVNSHPDADSTVVTLHSGRVEISANGQQATLRPGQQLVCYHSDGKFKINNLVKTQLPDWRSNVVTLRDYTLNKILNLTCEYYEYNIMFASDTVKFGEELFTVHLDKNKDIEELLRPFSAIGGFAYRVEGTNLIIQHN